MNSVVLDASAVLAYVRNEPGADVVGPRLIHGAISAVNYSEVLKKLVETGGNLGELDDLFRLSEVQIISFDDSQAITAAKLFATTSVHGLSFADRACLALAIQCSGVVYTAEERMGEANVPITVTLIRKRAKAKGKPQ